MVRLKTYTCTLSVVACGVVVGMVPEVVATSLWSKWGTSVTVVLLEVVLSVVGVLAALSATSEEELATETGVTRTVGVMICFLMTFFFSVSYLSSYVLSTGLLPGFLRCYVSSTASSLYLLYGWSPGEKTMDLPRLEV